MVFDGDNNPFDNAPNSDLDPSKNYLLALSILTILFPFICSYLFGKTFQYFCCRRNNYKLSISLQSDKLWIKSLLSRWFIVIQALIMGYLWCEYLEELWLQH